MELIEVKATFVRIQALEDERDRYKKEAKRCQDDIDATLLALRRKALDPGDQEAIRFGELSEVSGE